MQTETARERYRKITSKKRGKKIPRAARRGFLVFFLILECFYLFVCFLFSFFKEDSFYWGRAPVIQTALDTTQQHESGVHNTGLYIFEEDKF